MDHAATTSSRIVDPLVNKIVKFWYGRTIFEHGGRWKETPLLEAARVGDETTCFLILELLFSMMSEGETTTGTTTKTTSSLSSSSYNKTRCCSSSGKAKLDCTTTPTVPSTTTTTTPSHTNTINCCDHEESASDTTTTTTTTTRIILDARNIRNRNALHCAVASSNIGIARLLLTYEDKSCAIMMMNATDVRGDTPVHVAVRAGNVEMLQLLLESAASKNHERNNNNHELPPEQYAGQINNAVRQRQELQQAKGRDDDKSRLTVVVNMQNKQGESPLHIASERGSPPLSIRNCVSSPPTYSADSSSAFTQSEFCDNGIAFTSTVPAISQYGQLQDRQTMVGLLLRYGSNIHSKDVNGSTPLHRAAAEGQLGVVRILLDYNSSASSRANIIQDRDNSGRTPLDVAKISGHESTAAFLSGRIAQDALA